MEGLPVNQYRDLASDMFKQIYMIKDILSNQTKEYEPLTEEQKIKFKFKKRGFNKLLLFDMDETLIHVKRRSEEGAEQNDENMSESSEESFCPEVEIKTIDPTSKTEVPASFSVRPFVKQCLELANKYFEVAVFTASK